MKHSRTLLLAVATATSLAFVSCKGKNNSNTNTDTATTVAPQAVDTAPEPIPAPVAVSADDSLTTKATDAIKDFPGVTATVSNGEVTLTGEISKDKLPKVMQAVNAIHPKKVINQLTIKK
ncbi:BON domain-containing protein [Chitinophaga sp.]|uniref:BON domain-containing protein n=1 Tax=Chitinophaga sp. TaxID=1869181 RepID=UPI0031D05759